MASTTKALSRTLTKLDDLEGLALDPTRPYGQVKLTGWTAPILPVDAPELDNLFGQEMI